MTEKVEVTSPDGTKVILTHEPDWIDEAVRRRQAAQETGTATLPPSEGEEGYR